MAIAQSFGLAFAASTTSFKVFCGRAAVISSTSGARAVRATTSRSVSGSKFAPFSTIGMTAVLNALASSV